MRRAQISAVLSILLIFQQLPGGLPAAFGAQDAPKLRITIVEGDGAINNVKQRVQREPIVQVEDENRKPVAGAAVLFFLPSQGPGGVFADGSKTFSTITDAQGRAVMRGFRPNSLQGKFEIRVTASSNGQSVSTAISQSNALGAVSTSAAGGGLSTTAKLLIILGVVGAGAAGGIFAATRGGSSGSSGTPQITPTVITPGTPTVGGPR